MNSQYQEKNMLKEKATHLQKHAVTCSRRNLGITLLMQSNQREKQRKSSQILRRPFRGAPHIHRDGVRGKKFFSPRAEDRITENSVMVAANFVNRHKQVNKDMNMVNIHSSSRTFFNMNLVPEITLNWELEKVHPLAKRLFSSKKVPNVPIAGRLKHSAKTWKKLTRNQSMLDLVDGSNKTFLIKDSFPTGNKSRTTKTDRHGSEGNVEKAGYKTRQDSKGRVVKQFIPCKKEEWGAKTSNKSETSKCTYTIQSLQNGRIAESEIFLTRRRLYVQAQSKGCISLFSFTGILEEIHLVPLARKLTPISVPMFSLVSYPSNFHKTIENPNCNFAFRKYKNSYLLG